MKHVSISDVGPIEHLDFELPEQGGVVVFRGRNGTGKSHAIEAVSALMEKDRGRNLSSRDGASRGEVEGLGVQLTIGRRTSTRGELEVVHIDADDPSKLVDPGLQDEAAADERRLQVLCRLARIKPDPAMFAGLVGGDESLRKLVRPTTLELASLPAMADAMRRDFQAEARKQEGVAENEGGQAAGLYEGIKGLDLSAPSDEAELAVQLEAAVRASTAIAEQQRSQNRRRNEAVAARAKLDELCISMGDAAMPEGIDVLIGAHRSVVTSSDTQIVELENEIRDRQARIMALKEKRAGANDAIKQLMSQQKDREATAALMDELKRTADLDLGDPIEDVDVQAAAADVEAARKRVQDGAIVRRAIEAKAKADAARDRARAADRTAAALRDAAKGCDEVISNAIRAVAPRGLVVKDGRLYATTDRGSELFSMLSDGERWRIALEVAIDAVGEGGLLAIAQVAWEGLDPINRGLIAAHAKQRNVWILTAEADAGELRAETFNVA